LDFRKKGEGMMSGLGIQGLIGQREGKTRSVGERFFDKNLKVRD